ncbi:hypothetical protein [uncultured Flavobacterium sp.]|uniref:hypothetical protein n=1 Tax=uncultured Flavobacterium sp. TaxID=165435 RepID=UPI00293136FE|nr:hypothetical protein [uncultured Flavobacterium sp.]
MVQVIGYELVEKENGDDFLLLILQGGIEAVKSETTGKMYFTARTVKVPATFDEDTCKSIIGSQFEGTIMKVPTDSYSYMIKETGEEIVLKHRYEYVTDTDAILKEQIINDELVY